jgi:hypothetical protein
MPHPSHIWRPTEDGLVTLRFYVPSDMVTPDADEVLIHTGAGGDIRVPQTLITESDEPGYVVFEARVPSDVAAALRSTCEALFGQRFIEEEQIIIEADE